MKCARADAWRISSLPSCKKYFARRYAQIAYYDKAIFVFLCMDEVKKPIDLGHDDVDGQECKDGRSRTWMILLYPDNPEHKAVLDGRLADLDWNYAGRVHDKDDGVKEHHHVVVLFKDGRKNADIAADLGIDKRWLRAWDRQKKALRYLCHRDNPEKFQYSTDGIYGTIAEKAVAACSKGNELSEKESVLEIVHMLDEIDGYISDKFFISLIAERGLWSVYRRMGNTALRLIDQHNQEYRKALEKDWAEKVSFTCDRESFEAFMKWQTSSKMPFEEQVTRLERQGYKPPILPMED